MHYLNFCFLIYLISNHCELLVKFLQTFIFEIIIEIKNDLALKSQNLHGIF